MSSTSGFEHVPRWQWPEDLNQGDDWDTSSAASSRSSSRASSERASANSSPLPRRRSRPYAQTSIPREEPQRTEPSANTRQKHWRPRQCRICLDTVQPTFNVPSENLPGFLQSTGNVKYEDENGRLLRPCLCKGSAKYVHEACLQAWRHADAGSRRNYWQCPTCKFKYRLARLGVGNLIGSKGKLREKLHCLVAMLTTRSHANILNSGNPHRDGLSLRIRCRPHYQHVCRPLEFFHALEKLPI